MYDMTTTLTTKVYVCACVCSFVVLQSNYLVFMAELFWWFEVVKPSFVQPRVFDPNGTVQLHHNISMLLLLCDWNFTIMHANF